MMTLEHLLVGAAATASVVLYLIGSLQIRRALPERVNWLIVQCVLTGVSGVIGAALSGSSALFCASAPACVAAVSFIAGNGSVAVLIHEGGDEVPMSAATAQARTRFGFIGVALFVVGLVVVTFLP